MKKNGEVTMTDEEKANEYVLREDVETMKYSECYGERVFFEKEVKKGYLNGLSEGRKELEKENAELKAQIEKMPAVSCSDCVAFGKHCPHSHYTYSCKLTVQALEKENEELKEKIAVLESIIERLQSCTNCEHFDGTNYCKSTRCVIHQFDGYCPTWELAEE